MMAGSRRFSGRVVVDGSLLSFPIAPVSQTEHACLFRRSMIRVALRCV
ncbi:hypothetical protein ALO46_102544 [Pseudomonas syringae pv. solidagae]|nr:hypothetical protein ALO46_102544 [Pseudomonas syringae pv. solidagae]RMR47989.1 hypothetical protein ALP85_102296 [Pseudomonas syringae pv. syringae]